MTGCVPYLFAYLKKKYEICNKQMLNSLIKEGLERLFAPIFIYKF